eukprot:UN28460
MQICNLIICIIFILVVNFYVIKYYGKKRKSSVNKKGNNPNNLEINPTPNEKYMNTYNRNLQKENKNWYNKNLIYIKVHKTGSTSMASIVQRIGIHYKLHDPYGIFMDDLDKMETHLKVGLDHWIKEEPGVWNEHENRLNLKSRLDSLKLDKMYLTFLREPTDRCISAWNWVFRKPDKIPKRSSDSAKMKFFNAQCINYSYDYIKTKHKTTPQNVLDSYYFVGITERFNESILLLKFLMDLTWSDILYSPLKVKNCAPAYRKYENQSAIV